jgi:paraquat-inducible protein A
MPTHPGAFTSALQRGLWRCDACGTLGKAGLQADADEQHLCASCGASIEPRKTDSIGRTWALLLAAAALYVPANVLPVTVSSSLLGTQDDTILVLLSYLLLSVQRRRRVGTVARLRMYRMLETIGRWSMLDVFVITILAALVQIQSFASLQAGPGAAAFGAVVVLTMLATRSFDPRLIFDAAQESAEMAQRRTA